MDNYIQFNIRLAQILGLHAAIYLSELMNINEKAVRKDKLSDDFFTVDRDYVEKRTTISKDEQKELDTFLLNFGVLKKSDSDKENGLTLDLTVLTSLVSADPVSLKSLEKLVAASKEPKKRRTKAEAIIDSLKAKVKTQNEELRCAYNDWIDSVYAKQGWMSVKSVTCGESLIDQYSNHNLDLALKLLEIASLNGYRDIQWAINKYESEYKVTYRVPNSVPSPGPVQLSSEVF